MWETLPKKGKYSSLKKGKKACLQLGTLPKQTVVRHFKQCFIFLFLASNIFVLSIPFFYSHRGEKTLEIRGHQGPPTS
ncbi:hypothetical protein AB205_0212970 [Aquarana catesbeiana]|uniref:Uncharacterized protein n=1 Tax=Aquarana catesbeiana TaxID=8400 RepID=A0A2G9SJ87_AQUCT|nr:hypothetical protein AB205_0212970 [Aquarana catesbeiana]